MNDETTQASQLALRDYFDQALDAGMWCATAYVVRAGCSETVAVPFGA